MSVADRQVRRLQRTHTILIRGPIGIGKSSLVSEWIRPREGGSGLILRGGADQTDSRVPLAAFRDAVAYARGHRLATGTPDSLDRFEYSLGIASDADLSLQSRRTATVAAFTALLTDVEPGRPPAIVVIEDLHCADRDTLVLCSSLVRQHTGGAVLMVLTTRPGFDDVTDEIVALVERQSGRGLGEIIELGPLDRPEVTEILSGRLPARPSGELVDRAQSFSGGNPLFLGLMVDSLLASGKLTRDGDRCSVASDWHPVAPHDLVRRTVGSSDPELRVAASLSLLGRCPEDQVDVVAAGAELSVPDTREQIDVLGAKGILGESEGRVEFSHQIFRETFQSSQRPYSRRLMHRRMAELLMAKREAGTPIDLFGAASHIAQGYTELDDRSRAALLAAAESALSSAPVAAARWFALARRELAPTDPRFSDLLAHQLLGLGLSSRTREATSLLDELWERVPPELRSDQLVELSGSMYFSSRRVADGLSVIGSVPPAQQTVWMRAVRLALLSAQGDPETGREDFDVLMAELRADPGRCPVIALHYLVTYSATAGLPAETDLILQWMEAASSEPSVSAPTRGLLSNIALTFCRVSPRGLAASDFTSIRYGSGEDPRGRTLATDDAGTAAMGGIYHLYLNGQWDRAVEILGRDLETVRASGNVLGYEFPAAIQAHIATARGEIDTATELLGSIGEESGIYFPCVEAGRGNALLAAGDAGTAVSLMSVALERSRSAGLVFFADYLADCLCEALIDLDRNEEALAVAESVYTWLSPLDLPMLDLSLSRAMSRATGDPSYAVGSLERTGAHRSTFEEARTRTVLGALGHEPRENLRSAHALFGQLRARTEQGRAEAVMRRQGISVPRVRATATTLTPVEGDVTKLVVRGLSTRQIAEELHYSPKTVEMHLSRVYARTKNPGRIALVRAYSRGELTILEKSSN